MTALRTGAWAVVFPGQGERDVSTALTRLFSEAPAWRRMLEDVTGTSADVFLARGGRALDRTELYQPAMVALSLSAWRGCQAMHEVSFVAGHSLGDLAAWAVVHEVAPREAVALAFERGVGMAAVAREVGGGMLAVPRDQVDALLSRVHAAGGRACVALENARDELVVSGDARALEVAGPAYRRLPGLGPWHGPWLEPVAQRLRASAPLVGERAAQPEWLGSGHPADHLTRPVRWVAVVDALVARGVTDVAIAGPGRTQRALLRALLPREIRVHLVDAHNHPGVLHAVT